MTKWPFRNLGGSESWGRDVERRIETLQSLQRQVVQGVQGQSRYTAASAQDLQIQSQKTLRLAEDLEVLIRETPRYFSESTARSGYGAGSGWTTVAQVSVRPPDSVLRTCRVSANAALVSYRDAGAPTSWFIWPFPLEYVSSEYGPRPPLPFHNGIDFAGGPASEGSNIPAAANGTVILKGYYSDWGNYLRVDHSAITGIPNNWTGYAHLQSPSPLNLGDPVTQGQTVGQVGATGFVTGPHLHYEIAVDNGRISPRAFMETMGGAAPGAPALTRSRIVINGVPSLSAEAEGGGGASRQLNYSLSGATLYNAQSVTIELQVQGGTEVIPVDARNLATLTAYGAWS